MAETLTTSIRIEVDQDRDDRLEAWAERECRSKREHVLWLVKQVLDAYQADPLVMHRIAIQAGDTSARPAHA